ncbi:MAG: tetratricopeptide repeat protein, partial [Gemmatimonadetes bacterium]|nr:tetratricopeptide repeat protein [Gemmatimonadota bacterium]NIX44647.1 tetratricopeptide repeat protein [Gemmatimonadota bacterium]
MPITLALDEHGVIRKVHPQKEELEDFLSRDYPPPAEVARPAARKPDPARLRAAAEQEGTAEAWRAYANALTVWGDPGQLEEAIAAYRRALDLEPNHGPTHFRLGVAYRKRYDSDLRRQGDFQQAVEHWARALDTDPNQYIWRRRIQQYGPRLDKPYPFYDWVRTARREIRRRGEQPVKLRVEPGGAEFAHPAESFAARETPEGEPDPQGRVYRDDRGFVKVESTVVPPRVAPGETARVHLLFRPNLGIQAHWNNEVGPLTLWLDPPAGWQVDSRALTVENPPQP